MMQNKTKWARVFLAFIFLLSSAGAYAITPADQNVRQGISNAPAPDTRMKKRIEVFKAIRGDVLYTEMNTYDLTNVKVTYSNKKLQDEPTDGGKRIVGLIFLDEILKEVVVYP
jgi:hypothetical protein